MRLDPIARPAATLRAAGGALLRSRPRPPSLATWWRLVGAALLAAPLASAGLAFAGGAAPATSSSEAPAPTPAAEPEEAAGGERAPLVRERVEVVGRADAPGEAPLPNDELRGGAPENLALALEGLPGVAALRRSASAAELVVRGLGWERVQTDVDGLPLFGACPGRMDPPASLLAPAALVEARVVKALPSVTLGPGGSGGRVEAKTAWESPAGAAEGLVPFALARYDGARGPGAHAGAQGRFGGLDLRAGAEWSEFSDYEGAGGDEVPAGGRERGAFASLGGALGARARLEGSVIARRGEDIDYPALPMDTEFTDTALVHLGLRVRAEPPAPAGTPASSWRFDELALRGGLGLVDHRMSNARKANRAALEAATDSEADSLALHASTSFARAGNKGEPAARRLVLGADLHRLERDARRTRRVLATGMSFRDHLWPDARVDTLGAFAELHGARAAGRLRWRLGLRVDRVASDARAAGDPALGGGTVADAWGRFYGEGARDPEREETLVSGNVLASWQLGAGRSLYAGLGQSARAAGVTERFFAFAPAPGGFLVGNPGLDAERRRELSFGYAHSGEALSFEAEAFVARVDDYVAALLLERRDVNGDGTLDAIRGFDNVDAELLGAELSLELALGADWRLAAALSLVRAEKLDEGKPLPEIPPHEALLSVERRVGGRLPGALTLGARFVDGQERIDPAFPEDETSGFTLWHLRGRFALREGLSLRLAVENLLDRAYNEHLTREALLPAGDLAPGDEVPGPGRHVVVALSYEP